MNIFYKTTLIFAFLLTGINFAASPSRADTCEANICLPDPKIKISDTLTQKLKEKPDCPTINGKTICTNTWLAEYIAEVYKYAVGVVGILATVVMMIGGFIWISSAGNAGQVGEAKAWIGGALTGLVLVLSSYLILYQVNPKTTQMNPIKITKIDPLGRCVVNNDLTQCTQGITKLDCEKKDGKWEKGLNCPAPCCAWDAANLTGFLTFSVASLITTKFEKCRNDSSITFESCEALARQDGINTAWYYMELGSCAQETTLGLTSYKCVK